ncbi:MAG TPA: hypothetical protein DD397_02860 [Hyphomonas sp.]|nr:hypothetical protein [Hyphomonas sp.]
MPEDLGLLGEHQRANAALAAMAVQLFGNSTIIDQNAIFEGARNVVWPARMQRLKDGPLTALAPNQEIWLDGGHNPHAARAIARQLNNMPGRTALVAAMLASKDATGYFMPFRQVRPEVFTLPNAPGHQGAEPQALAEAATNAGLKAAAYDSLEAALKAAATTGVDRILICGSLYLAGEVLAQNGEPPA